MTAYRENLSMEKGDIPYRVLLSACSRPHQLALAHWHDVYEILLIRTGSCLQRVGSMQSPLSAGAIVIIPPGLIHETYATAPEGCAIDVLQFMPHLMDTALPAYFIRHPSLSVEAVKQRFMHIEQAIQDNAEKNRLIIWGAILELMGQLIRMLPESALQRAPSTGMIAKACRMMEQSPSLPLQQAAQLLGYTPEHFSRRFRQEMGCTFREYSDKIRMQQALQMMRSQQYTISQIAEQLGYADASSFARAFRRVYQLPPHQYMLKRVPLGEENQEE